MEYLDKLAADFATWAWGPWLVVLLLGAGAYFLYASRLRPFLYLPHAFSVLAGKHSNKDDEGDVSHFKALTAALSGTIGLGNIAGVAVAIQIGGPGAIFWMWITAIFGIATKFFTCTLSVMYREIGPNGEANAGPMYIIKNGLPKFMLPFAYFFAIFGIIGCLPSFQANQLVQITNDLYFSDVENFKYIAAFILVVLTSIVILGGLKRIAEVSAWLVPIMAVLYFVSVLSAILLNIDQLIPAFKLIFVDAFTGNAVLGGGIAGVIITGIRRGAFSNEAGIGTESLVHGAAKTSNPVKQGLVAMTGPIFDTLIMCTLTALIILISGVWQSSDSSGVTLTSEAFSMILGPIGSLILFLCVVSFGMSTIFTYSYYGASCAKFLFGESGNKIYQYIFILFVGIFSVTSLDFALNVVDGSFAMMAIPTLISTIWLAPKVVAKANDYFTTLKTQDKKELNRA